MRRRTITTGRRGACADVLSDGPAPRRDRPHPMIWDRLAACLGIKTGLGHVVYIPPGHRCNPSRRGQNGGKEKN